MPAEVYHSIAAEVSAELTVKGSRFIAHAAAVSGAEQAQAYVDGISAKFADATHNCFAYKIGLGDKAVFRYSDAGEPSGTAGRPIYQAIEARGLTNVAIVVTRYFGGTKLGTGGLIRAYSEVALGALQHAEVTVSYPQVSLSLRVDFQFTNVLHQLVDRFGAEIVKTDFAAHPVYEIRLKAADEDEFKRLMRDMTRGQVEFLA